MAPLGRGLGAGTRRCTGGPAGPALWHRRGRNAGHLPATQPGAPVLVFIHGGYWRALDKSDHSFVAPAFNAQGATVVVPNYALCPA
jgi:acetyl esterase/lipase